MSEGTELINTDVILKGIRNMVIFFTYTCISFFVPYGGVAWPEVWVLLVLWLLYYLLLLVLGLKYSPDMLKERVSCVKSVGESWDWFILPVYLLTTLALNITAGLDAGRYGWSFVPPTARYISVPFVLITYALPLWAILSNPFASGVARIQDERGHQVTSKGPYRCVRHPMYTATLLYGMFFPLYLGSWWAYIPGAVVIILFIVRTVLEDRMLQERLSGYKAYTQQTRYRLLPGIW